MIAIAYDRRDSDRQPEHMSKLYEQIVPTLQPGMTIPDSLRMLFHWIESNGTYIDTKKGARIGFLFPRRSKRKDGLKRSVPVEPTSSFTLRAM